MVGNSLQGGGVMSRDRMKKEVYLRQKMDIATERAIVQTEKREKRSRRPGEWEKMRKEFEPSAVRIHKNKLHEVFNE